MATARRKKAPAETAAKAAPAAGQAKKITPISPRDAQIMQAFLGRIDLKGQEVPAFNRVQALLGHVCGVNELTDEQLAPPPQQ